MSALTLVSDPTRRQILLLIAATPSGRTTVTKLAEALELRQPTVSHHAKLLFDGGLLDRTPEGRQVWYSIAPGELDRLTDMLGLASGSAPDDSVTDRIIDDLASRFEGTFSRETVARYVHESQDLLARSAPAHRLASLAAGFAADRLTALASEQQSAPDGTPEVLFVCVQNAGRSQLAAAILRHLAGERVHVRTAGSEPAAVVASTIANALDEIGVPLGGEYPKPLTDDVVRAADVVITMGCGDACPVYPGKRYLDWELDDPVGRPLEDVRRIRDDIDRRVRQLLAEVERPPSAS